MKEIVDVLQITFRTVGFHKYRIMKELESLRSRNSLGTPRSTECSHPPDTMRNRTPHEKEPFPVPMSQT